MKVSKEETEIIKTYMINRIEETKKLNNKLDLLINEIKGEKEKKLKKKYPKLF